jgi:hypothetical protein
VALNDSSVSQAGKNQRYGQYKLQFFDYNSRGNNDTTICDGRGKPGKSLGDQDCDNSITGDYDDESLGLGPAVFPKNLPLPELYLVNKSGAIPTRLFLRLKIERDPDAPPTAPCDTTGAGSGSGCIGRLQMLRLIGKDLGSDHAKTGSAPSYDGKIDTWECQQDFPCRSVKNMYDNYLPTGVDSEWIDVFSRDISVNSAQFFLNPNLDYNLAWKDTSDTLANSYLRMRLSLGYSWKKRKLIKLAVPEINITTTLNLRK